VQAVLDWPGVEALLLLDSFKPSDRPAVWQRVDDHAQPVWNLLQARQGVGLGRAHSEMRGRGHGTVPAGMQF
jgi:hypothetical protein